jgi:hypothetical protein
LVKRKRTSSRKATLLSPAWDNILFQLRNNSHPLFKPRKPIH